MTRNVNHTIFPTFYFFNNNEVRDYSAIFQWHITPNETLNNFKCTLQIQATSTEELGKLKKKEIIYYESHLVSHRKTPAVSGICLVCHLERNIYYVK